MKCDLCGREVNERFLYLPRSFPRIGIRHSLASGKWVCAYCIAENCGIEIPFSLVEKLPGAHYIKVAKCSKRPIDKDWSNHPMRPDDPILQQHLARGGNYGVIGGIGIVIVDVDTEKVKQSIKERLPETFTVQSPGSLGWHCYYRSDLKNPVRLKDVDVNGRRVNVGDVQGYGKMVVGPNSFHPNGQRYKIIRDLPLAWVSAEKLREVLSPWTVPLKEKVSKLTRQAQRERALVDINILDVVPSAGLKRSGDEYYGSHPGPSHGSSTGHNFWINPSKNVWHCFRHDTGGGPLLWIAVEEDIIKCEEAVPGALRGEVFKRVLEAAERRGFKVPKFLKEKIWETPYEVIIEGVKIGHLETQEYKLRVKT